jgi:flagellar hook-associated protein 2
VTGGPDAIGYTNSQSSGHVFGLASGMDVDSMVQKMMTAASIPLVQMEQQKQLLEWQQDDYRSMNSALLDLQTQTFNMSLQGSYLLRQATSSNTSLVTATAGSNSPKTSYSITSGSLATAASVNSASTIQKGTVAIDPTKSLWVNRDRLANFTYTTTTVYCR